MAPIPSASSRRSAAMASSGDRTDGLTQSCDLPRRLLRFELPLPRMPPIPESEIFDQVADRVAKSLVAADGVGAKQRLWCSDRAPYPLKKSTRAANATSSREAMRSTIETCWHQLRRLGQPRISPPPMRSRTTPSRSARLGLRARRGPIGRSGDRVLGSRRPCRRNIPTWKERRAPVSTPPVSSVSANRCSMGQSGQGADWSTIRSGFPRLTQLTGIHPASLDPRNDAG
jgi:hypothetical protein